MMQEVEMKYLLMGLVATLVLTTFIFAAMTKAVYVELREWSSKGKSGHKD
jgi:hypothetical protein